MRAIDYQVIQHLVDVGHNLFAQVRGEILIYLLIAGF